MRPSTYKHYLLGVLTVILLFNFVDRMALGLVLQDVKVDLHLSDTQLGLLTGLAFALFYAVMGIPIARWADRGNRVLVISLTAALWSVTVGLCGVATSFTQLLLIRVAVGVGEAGCVPPAFSLMADYFNRAELPRATAIYGMGGPLSALVGLLLAGWLNELYGWRVMFMLLGIPGLCLAVVAWSTLKEPRRAGNVMVAAAVQPSLREVVLVLWRNVTYRHLVWCGALMFFFLYGISVWQPTFFVRSYGLKTGEIGTWLAVVIGIGGLLGTYLGGEFAARYAANNERLQLKASAATIGVSGLLSALVYVSPNKTLAFALVGLATAALYATNGPMSAVQLALVPERMRAMSSALSFLVANLVGMGLGPLAAGALSDGLHGWAGEESLRYALLILSPGYFWCAWYAWRASTTVGRDLVTVAPRHGEAHAMSRWSQI